MKKIYVTLVVMLIVFSINAQSPIAQARAQEISQKMKDSLSLTEAQREQILSLNLQIHNEKLEMCRQYVGTDSLTMKVQGVENKRDSLYRPVLGEEKYLLYRQKKRYLLNNN